MGIYYIGCCLPCLSNEDGERVLFSIQTHKGGELDFLKRDTYAYEK
jgi:hypothetical protein